MNGWVAIIKVLGEMVARKWVIGGMQGDAVFVEIMVVMAKEKLVLGFGFGKIKIKVGGDEMRSGD